MGDRRPCPQCAEDVKLDAKVCHFCNYDLVRDRPGVDPASASRAGVATVCAILFPGLGHFYAGYFVRGLFAMSVLAGFALLSLLLVHDVPGFACVAFPAYIAFWAYTVWDARGCAGG